MTTGLQVWDSTGKLVFDGTKRVGRIITLVALGGNGSFTDARLTQGQPFYCFHADGVAWMNRNQMPSISISGNTLTWTYPAGTPQTGYLMIGVY